METSGKITIEKLKEVAEILKEKGQVKPARIEVAQVLYIIGDTMSAAKTLRHGPPKRIFIGSVYNYVAAHICFLASIPLISNEWIGSGKAIMSWSDPIDLSMPPFDV